MDYLARILGGDLQASTPGPTDDFWYGPAGASALTVAGVRVDEEGAQKLSAWFRGKDILSTALAMLPLQIFERLPEDRGAKKARSNPLYDVLHRKPNPWQDSFQWRRQGVRHIIDYGNAYNIIKEGPRGFVDELWPVHPTLVEPKLQPSGRVLYRVRQENGGQPRIYTQDEIFHLRGVSEDGVTGVGILKYARQSLGLGMAVESYAAQTFGKGTINGGVIKVPTKLDSDASKRMAASFVTAAGNWALPKVLEQGADWTPNDMSPEDFQMLLSRKFTVTDIARWLGLPPHMLADLEKSSFSNIEHQGQEFVTYSLGPWLSMWEFGINDQLILNVDRFYAQFKRDALVRGALADRWAAYQIAVSTGTFTRNEVRGSEDMPALDGLDEPLDPAHLTGKGAAAENAPADPPKKKPAPVPEDTSQAHAIVVESAARILRKEVKAMAKLGVQHASDENAFGVAVTEFYSAHVALLCESLLMSEAQAQRYCAGQAAQVLEHGIAVVEAVWTEPTYAKGLAAWALDREVAA